VHGEMKTHLLATAMTLALLAAVIAAHAEDSQAFVERTVEVTGYGLVIVKDRITGHGGSAFTLLVPSEDAGGLISHYVSGASFDVRKRDDGSVAIEIRPTSQVVEVWYALRGKVEQRTANTYVLRLVDVPVMEGMTYSANVTLRLPTDSSFSQVPTDYQKAESSASRSFGELPAGKPSANAFTFTGTGVRLLSVESLVEEFEPYSGKLRLSLVLRNDDVNGISSVDLVLPEARSVKVLRVGDDLGTLRSSFDPEAGKLTVYLTPERYELRQGWRYGFSVLLDVSNAGLYVLRDGGLEVHPFLPVEAPVESFRVRVALPEGVRLAEVPDYVVQLLSTGGTVADLRSPVPLPGPAPLSSLRLSLSGSPAQPWGAYALAIGVLALVLGSVLAQFRVRRGSRPKIAESDRAALSRVREAIEEVLVEVEEISRVLRSPEKSALPALRERVQRVKRSSDAILEELRRISYRGPEVSKMTSEVQRSSTLLNESLRTLLKTYTDFARGELSRSSLEKMTAPILKDVRSSVAGIREVAMMVDELVG